MLHTKNYVFVKKLSIDFNVRCYSIIILCVYCCVLNREVRVLLVNKERKVLLEKQGYQ